jgi:tRNA pseudouridine55 synthase
MDSYDMNGVFAINKPSGITSAQFLARIQQIFTSSSVFAGDLAQLRGAKVEQLQREGQKASRRKLRRVMKVKMGHGGTLDPLASGVLVVGVGKGTKKLQDYLNGSVKVYETEALFGASTTTGDVEGELLTRAGTKHLTKEQLDAIPEMFIGHTKQTPPIFAALKMNGKPLYEYAREGLPLPRAIEPRQVQIYELDIFDDSLTLNHNYDFIKSALVEGERIEEKLASNPTLNDSKVYLAKEYSEKNGFQEEIEVGKPQEVTEAERSDNFKAPLLHLKTKVSSGTYIRSLISDIGRVLKSNAYMVKLVRAQQAEWELGKNVFNMEDFERGEAVWGKVLSQVFQKGGREIDDISSLFTQAEAELPAVKENSNTASGQPGHSGDQTKSTHAQQQQKKNQEEDISSSIEQTKKRPLEE